MYTATQLLPLVLGLSVLPLSSQTYGFCSSHVWMWELDYKESWAPKNWCFWTVVLEKTPESPLDSKEIQPVHPKGNQSWIFIGGTDAEAETLILWPPDVKNWIIGKDPDAGKDWRQEEKGMTEDEMLEWHHRLDGWEFEQVLGVGDGQGSLGCCSPWGRKKSDTIEWPNWTHYHYHFSFICINQMYKKLISVWLVLRCVAWQIHCLVCVCWGWGVDGWAYEDWERIRVEEAKEIL